MNTNKNTYTIIYATVLVLLVAAILTIVSVSLQSKQQMNIDNETRQNILTSVGLVEGVDEAENKMQFIEDQYNKYITDSYLVTSEGEIIRDEKVDKNGKSSAFKLSLKSQYDIMKQSNPDASKLTLPVFVCTNGNDEYQVFPIYGAGLWGPIWGYIALESDFNTIRGAIFDHKSETPGLGAEIATPWFRNQFNGKKIFEGNTFTSIIVQKGGAEPDDPHAVDAITGGTITSRSLQRTIDQWFNYYMPYIQKQLDEQAAAASQIDTVNSVKEENYEEGDL